jgi:hypothetical protein
VLVCGQWQLLLAWHIRHPDDIVLACEKAVCGTHAVLRETIQYYARHASSSGSSTLAKNGAYPELKIIPSKRLIEHPPLLFRAEDIKSSS